jgi:hypothetical protein
MSKKNLLNESTIRKFMKLASIEPLASDFISKIQEAEEEDVEEGMRPEMKDDDDLEEGRDKDDMDEGKHDDDLEEGRDKDDMDEGKHDDDLDERGGMEFKHDDDLDERGDMMFKDDDDMDMGAEAGGKMVDVDAFINALESALETAMGEPAEVEYEEDEAEVDLEEPEGDLDMDMDMAADAEEDEEEDDLAESIYKEVLKRVSKQK